MFEISDWREAGKLFEGIDFENEADVLKLIDRLSVFRDSIDLNGLSRQAEEKICPEKRRYSVGNRTMPPLGCYEPMEAMIACTNNITKGRLVKKADDPAYTYDYDEAGNVVRICHLYSKEDGPRLHGQISSASYGLHDERVDLFIEWWPSGTHGITKPGCGELRMLILTVKDENGRPRLICKAEQVSSKSDMQPEVESWGPAVNGKMECRQYMLHTDFDAYKDSENRERKIGIVRDEMVCSCDERGRPKGYISCERKVLKSTPFPEMMRDMWVTIRFGSFIEEIQKNKWNVFGVEYHEKGQTTRRWGDKVNRHPIYSATKTITSIAVGMAADEGKMDINRSVLRYLPEAAVRKMTEAQRAVYEKITVERLLTMSVVGYPFRPAGESWLDAALSYEIPDVNKREFDYSNVSAYLAGVAAAEAVGENLYEYLTRKLFEPLGIVNPPYMTCPDGYFYGASGMELTVGELSRIGLLLMQGGVYEGKRLLSEEYVKAATAVQQMNREGGYGYFIWKYRDGFSINGKWGQKCYVLPEKGRMVTYLSHIEEKCPGLKESMERKMLGIEPAGD